MRLKELLARGLGLDGSAGAGPDPDVTGVTADSRAVQPGHVFVAIAGYKEDGHRYAADALARGACAIVAERPVEHDGVAEVVVPDTRAALARLAAELFGRPSRRVRVVGVTGTNGKTTTTFLVRSIVREATARECGLLGTIAYEAFGRSQPSSNTTPDPVRTQAFLASLDRPDGGFAAMEVSSHALSQRRVDGIDFEVAVFTNLSPEHLDYHETMEAYRDAKAALFRGLRSEATAVLNAEDEASACFAEATRARVLLYSCGEPGLTAAREVRAEELVIGSASAGPGAGAGAGASAGAAAGSRFRLVLPTGEGRVVSLALVGRHNVENALAAAGAGFALGFPIDAIVRGLEACRSVPGRLEPVVPPPLPGEWVGVRGVPRVLVDYAHTDDALSKVLRSLRPVAEASGGRLICLFGCGGDRDRTKRPRMGRVVERLADVAVVTSDNPRSEAPGAIIAEILRGFVAPARAIVESDRRSAIALAIGLARPEDLVLLAGKGHERYQIVGDRTVPFDDREVAREALAAAFGPD